MIKAVFFDVDGTLISHRIHDMPASTLKALRAMRERGVQLFLATGRHKLELADLPMHGFRFDGYVAMTGQVCYDADFNAIYTHPIAPGDARTLGEIFNAHEIPMVFNTAEDFYINCVNELVERTQADISTAVPHAHPYAGEDIYIATAYGTPAQLQALIARLPRCRLSVWHPNSADIVSVDGGKVPGIEAMLAHCGLRREETMAFGDSFNDAEMLRYAGVGVAMGNAEDEIKALADYVTTDIDEDGILNAARLFRLID